MRGIEATSKQVKSLIDKVDICGKQARSRFFDSKQGNSLTANKGIDTALGRFNPSTTSNGRRFPLLPKTVSTDRVNQWLRIIERQYCMNID